MPGARVPSSASRLSSHRRSGSCRAVPGVTVSCAVCPCGLGAGTCASQAPWDSLGCENVAGASGRLSEARGRQSKNPDPLSVPSPWVNGTSASCTRNPVLAGTVPKQTPSLSPLSARPVGAFAPLPVPLFPPAILSVAGTCPSPLGPTGPPSGLPLAVPYPQSSTCPMWSPHMQVTFVASSRHTHGADRVCSSVVWGPVTAREHLCLGDDAPAPDPGSKALRRLPLSPQQYQGMVGTRSREAAWLCRAQGHLQRTHSPVLQLRDAAQVRGRPDAGLGIYTASVRGLGVGLDRSRDGLLEQLPLGE